MIKKFKEIKIGNQIWMPENLNVDKFRNGDPVLQIITDDEWQKSAEDMIAGWCYYDNEPGNGKLYGKLYNWYAVNDPRGLAPKGWHIASKDEWAQLIKFLGGGNSAGKKLKNTIGWDNYKEKTGNGNNESGFAAVPGGFRHLRGKFWYAGQSGFWWSSTEKLSYSAWSREITYRSNAMSLYDDEKNRFLSVRCIKD